MYESIAFTLLFFSIVYHFAANGQNNSCKYENDKMKTLKLLREQSIADSLGDFYMEQGKNHSILLDHFEASGVELRPDGLVMYVIFDNSFQIGAFCTHRATQSLNCIDQLLDWPDESMCNVASEFEGIAYNSLNGTYFIIQETIPYTSNTGMLGSNIFEIRITSDDFISSVHLLESCQVEWEFESVAKGFEGLEFVIHKKSGKSYLLALCEANNCSMATIQEGASKNLGNGQIVMLEKHEATFDTHCHWKPVGIINLPLDAQFRDYSAVSVYRQKRSSYIAVISQEDSQLWIGTIEEMNEAPYYKLKSLNKNSVYNLPRTIPSGDQCPIVYCNVEGVVWQNKNQLILVSDEAKERHAPICANKDQMIHYFSLP